MITRFGFKLLRRKSVYLSFSKSYHFSDSESDYTTSDNKTSTYDETNLDQTKNENVNVNGDGDGDAQQKVSEKHLFEESYFTEQNVIHGVYYTVLGTYGIYLLYQCLKYPWNRANEREESCNEKNILHKPLDEDNREEYV